MNTEATPATMYTATTGTTCYLGDRRGITTGRNMENGRLVGMFVKLDGTGEMAYATLSETDNDMHHIVTGWSVIDRETFDSITGLDQIRSEWGWEA